MIDLGENESMLWELFVNPVSMLTINDYKKLMQVWALTFFTLTFYKTDDDELIITSTKMT